MCLTLPFKIKKIIGRKAELADGRQVSLDLIADPRIGDWILVNADLAVSKVDRREAEEIRRYWKGKQS